MEKFRLVIADTDASYLKKLGNYIMLHHFSRFDLFTFTSPGPLADFLKNNTGQLDIVLYGSGFPMERPDSGALCAIKLLDAGNPGLDDGAGSISKYMHVEKLIKEVLNCYSKRSNANFLPDGKKKSIIAVVHSSSGGTGKTSIAAGLSMIASRRGFRTLYLNLESIPSTRIYFKADSERSFSDVIYHLKDKEDNLALQLESACCTDPASGVHFLLPPESVLELEELSAEDIELFIRTLRTSSQYDFVFIDLAPGISRRSLFLLGTGDVTVKMLSRPVLPGIRDNIMEKELAMAGNGPEGYDAKTLTVLNKYCGGAGINRDKFNVIIGESENLKSFNGDRLLIDVDAAFTAALNKLFDSIASDTGLRSGQRREVG